MCILPVRFDHTRFAPRASRRFGAILHAPVESSGQRERIDIPLRDFVRHTIKYITPCIPGTGTVPQFESGVVGRAARFSGDSTSFDTN